ncbi:uncharacterized protein N7479_000698 [Penicillium vulpinum]|uniref:uncharacterized protein n=1 Tax=Penicillium vulpinum TaxID=29845 RepID=UPI002547E29B|nr:uncharacterized protein N7479_000698 [Penicillium vulpinum]KAJ5970780.1 hypothetical protein N7479_000698 [Penicillium vulpinum]
MPEIQSGPGDNVEVNPIGEPRKKTIPSVLSLGSRFFEYYSWSNKPADFPLDSHFDPDRPNIGDEFSLSGLQPVIKKKDEDLFLLKDANDDFYKWHLGDGSMFYLETKEKDPMKVAMMVMEGIPEAKWIPIYDPDTFPK